MLNASASLVLSLSGFSFSAPQRALLFCCVLLWYLLIVAANVILVALVAAHRALHAPMYVFMCSLCVNTLYGTLGFYPKFLWDLLRCGAACSVSYGACLLQGYVIHSSMCGEFSVLTLMAYDRYVAICRPLSYRAEMTRSRVLLLLLLSWLVPLLAMFLNTATVMGRALCGVRIQRLYCVNWMVTRLTCELPLENVAVVYFNMIFYFAHFLLVLGSYVCVLRACVNSRDSSARFSNTCVPHLVSLVSFTASVLLDLLYMRFGSAHISQHAANFFTIEFLLVPPLLNPLIYGLKLSKVRHALTLMLRLQDKAEGRGPQGRGSEGRGPQGRAVE
uniref:Olfactory receptor n=1 Tax=Knipowitschia caucasica TaxID=637954 RepID=A0AAV2JYG2_KNICA